MEGIGRKLSPAALVLALICFFLPFVTFSCQGQKVASFSGLQLATGTTIQQPQMFGPPKSQKVGAEPLAVLALLSVLAGVGASFLRGKKGAGSSAGLALLAVILLAALKSKLDGDALRQGAGAVQVNYEAGYYLTLILLLAAIGASVYALVAAKGMSLPTLQQSGNSKFCLKCGAGGASDDVFCKKCGAKFT
jgi:hypothetical protein